MVGDVNKKSALERFDADFAAAVNRIFMYADDFEEPVLIKGQNKIFCDAMTDTLNAYGPRDIAVNFGGDIESWEKSIKEQITEDDSLQRYGWGLPGTTALDFIRSVTASRKAEIVDELRRSWLIPDSDAWGAFVDKLTDELAASWRGWDMSGSGFVRVAFSEFDVSIYLSEVFEELEDCTFEGWESK